MNVVSFIFARGGSKRLPRKNIRLCGGKPLIAWTIKQIQKVPQIKRILVSTDSNKIALQARKFGAEVPFIRPALLSTDNASEWQAWRHAITWLKQKEGLILDAMVIVPCTSPLRNPNDIKMALDKFEKSNADAVVAVTPSHRNPWFNMVKIGPAGRIKLIKSSSKTINNSQSAPKSYDLTTVVYVVRPSFVLKKKNLFSGNVQAVIIPQERALDIDSKFDFKIADYFLRKKNN